MLSSADEILERAFKKALPKILKVIEKNKVKEKAKAKYLKRVKNRSKVTK